MSDGELVIRDLSFAYPAVGDAVSPRVLDHVDVDVPKGAFALLVGDTGSGKTTLLRLCKPEVAPAGERCGTVLVGGMDVSSMDARTSASSIGFVFQSPDNQIVCDTVWHEMAFGLENLGVPAPEMRLRIAETCYFLGIEPWFERKTAELSGGQRQVLALAATLAMRPRLLLLDEPTSMLDPVAEKGFLALLYRANRELGITVVVATHGPWAMRDYATMALYVRDGAVARASLAEVCERHVLGSDAAERPRVGAAEAALDVRAAWLRYGRDLPWVLRGCDLRVGSGEVRAVVGGNGCGKSTMLATVAGVLRPQRGSVRNACRDGQALLPQNPKALLSHETVLGELMAWSGGCGYGEADVRGVLARIGLGGDPDVLDRHPYDLSGGQQQLVAMGKLLLARPSLLLLDEPTKGLDGPTRKVFVDVVSELRGRGATVVVATHDLAFVRATCDTVTLLFGGQEACTMTCGDFFSSTQFFLP